MFRDGLAEFCTPETLKGYERIYKAENYFRFLVKWELIAAFGVNWRDGLGLRGVRAQETMTDEGRLGLIDVEPLNLMSYFYLSDLRKIIVEERWELFRGRLGRKEYLDEQLKTLNKLRNKTMHCRPLTQFDLNTLHGTLMLLGNLSRGYYETHRVSKCVELPRLHALPVALRHHVEPLISKREDREPQWLLERVTDLGDYWRLDFALQAGAFLDRAPVDLFKRADRDCFFAAASPELGRLDIYVPQCIDNESLAALSAELSRVSPLNNRNPYEDGFDDLEERYDGLFRLPVALPVQFRLR